MKTAGTANILGIMEYFLTHKVYLLPISNILQYHISFQTGLNQTMEKEHKGRKASWTGNYFKEPEKLETSSDGTSDRHRKFQR